MFDKDFWQEVWETIRRQKVRSLMTAFGVFWGLLILMFMVGAGVGFNSGVTVHTKAMSSNTVGYFTVPTTIAYGGLERGRRWVITDADTNRVSFGGDVCNCFKWSKNSSVRTNDDQHSKGFV